MIDHYDLKLSRQRMEALHAMHEHMIGIYIPEDNYEHLLHAHLMAMYWRIGDMLTRSQQRKFTMKIGAHEALAFCLLWGNEKFDMRMRGAPVVLDIIKGIDKARK